jgi:hypothetical protein
VNYTHLVCGEPAGLGPVCESCGKPLRRQDLIAEPARKYREGREARWETFKGEPLSGSPCAISEPISLRQMSPEERQRGRIEFL